MGQNCRFAILSNGVSHYLWDIESGQPEIITEFPTQASLLHRAKYKPNTEELISEKVDDKYLEPKRTLRDYQVEAIHAIQKAAKAGKNRFLLEMATGTGKTTTSGAICKLFLRTGNASRILFLVDRIELETQAVSGQCLSTKYINTTTKLLWSCEKGHKWEANLSLIKQGSWCPYCAHHVKLTIKEMQELAAKKGGVGLSKEYINSSTKLQWKCKEGHIFEASPSHIKTSKSWCPICGYKIVSEKGKYSMKEIREMAAKKGGECLSKKYNAGDKLLWRCREGPEWETKPHNIKNNGSWCPRRTEFINEELTRAMFDVKFMKCRPKWLIGSSGRTLELDGYNRDLGIAFEYQEEQHYNGDNYFFKKNIKTNINKRKIDDAIKRKLCQDNEVKLIEIPFKIKQKDYFNYIVEQCQNKGIKVNSNKYINHNDLYIFTTSKLQEMKDIAKTKGGDCILISYLGNSKKLLWKCEENHTWRSTPQNVKKGRWCPYCNPSKTRLLTIEEMQNIAAQKGGQCLSAKYVNSGTNLRWQCKKGHKWNATPSSIKHRTWCPYCAGKVPLTIEEMQELAAKKGGVCLSKEYINANTKLLWRCKKGHE